MSRPEPIIPVDNLDDLLVFPPQTDEERMATDAFLEELRIEADLHRAGQPEEPLDLPDNDFLFPRDEIERDRIVRMRQEEARNEERERSRIALEQYRQEQEQYRQENARVEQEDQAILERLRYERQERQERYQRYERERPERERLERQARFEAELALYAHEREEREREERERAERNRPHVTPIDKEDKTERYLKRMECPICLENESDTRLSCGHLCCGRCAIEIQECHICRTPITSRDKIYYHKYLKYKNKYLSLQSKLSI